MSILEWGKLYTKAPTDVPVPVGLWQMKALDVKFEPYDYFLRASPLRDHVFGVLYATGSSQEGKGKENKKQEGKMNGMPWSTAWP